jgi:hypothetical protein
MRYRVSSSVDCLGALAFLVSLLRDRADNRQGASAVPRRKGGPGWITLAEDVTPVLDLATNDAGIDRYANRNAMTSLTMSHDHKIHGDETQRHRSAPHGIPRTRVARECADSTDTLATKLFDGTVIVIAASGAKLQRCVKPGLQVEAVHAPTQTRDS